MMLMHVANSFHQNHFFLPSDISHRCISLLTVPVLLYFLYDIIGLSFGVLLLQFSLALLRFRMFILICSG